MYASYVAALAYVPRLRRRWAIATVVAVHVVFFLSPPLALTDIFNYVNYGRMEIVHHLNPYTTIPILEPHNDPSYDLSNWHQLLSPYGPLFTMLTFLVVPLGVAATFWVLKGVLALAGLATLLLVWKCARLLGRDPVKAIELLTKTSDERLLGQHYLVRSVANGDAITQDTSTLENPAILEQLSESN